MTLSTAALVAVLAAAVTVVIDGPRAAGTVAVVVALGLFPAVALVAGPGAGLALLVPAGLAPLTGVAGRWAGRRWPWAAGIDPLVPVTSPPAGLFGPRSSRAAGAAICLPAASWIGLNVQVGGAASASGAVFAVCFLWIVGAIRLLLSRTVEDIAVGLAVLGVAGAGTWVIEGGAAAAGDAVLAGALAPVAAGVAGWLLGRHQRPVEPGLVEAPGLEVS